jgi:Protein of unknown function (DUF2905)
MIVRESSTMPHTRIIADVVIAVVGVVLPWIARLGLGRLPREILSSEREFTLCASVTTGILVSAVLSLTCGFFAMKAEAAEA